METIKPFCKPAAEQCTSILIPDIKTSNLYLSGQNHLSGTSLVCMMRYIKDSPDTAECPQTMYKGSLDLDLLHNPGLLSCGPAKNTNTQNKNLLQMSTHTYKQTKIYLSVDFLKYNILWF